MQLEYRRKYWALIVYEKFVGKGVDRVYEPQETMSNGLVLLEASLL